MANNILFTTDENGEEIEVELPTKKEVCPDCKGEGKHIHDAFRYDSFTVYDAERDGLDFEEEVANMQSGMYDVTCSHCNGLRVVDVVDTSQLSDSEKADWIEQEHDRLECEAIMRAERMMGA